MHKPRLSLNLNKIIQKEKKKKESFTKFALSLTFHFSDTISGKLLNENTTF